MDKLFDDYGISEEIHNRFFEVFHDKNYPIIEIITDENYEEILKESVNMRNNIRGEDIGGLG